MRVYIANIIIIRCIGDVNNIGGITLVKGVDGRFIGTVRFVVDVRKMRLVRLI
jgi:hypothetical protein